MPHVEHGLGSGEGLAQVLQDNKHCIIALDELKLLTQKARIEHSSLLPMLTSLFHKNEFSNSTRKSRINLRGVHVSLLSACTTETFESMWTSEFLDIGFVNRLWLVPDKARKRIALPETIPSEKKQALAQRLADIVAFIHTKASQKGKIYANGTEAEIKVVTPIRLKLTDKARDLFEQWYCSRPLSEHSKRLDAYAKRLMILLAVSQDNLESIDSETVNKVIKLVDWQYNVRKAYDPIDCDNRMAAMEQRIMRTLMRNGPLPDGRLRKAVHWERYGTWFYETALKNLQNSGVLMAKKGRRGSVYFLGEHPQEWGV
nr:DUF3987 domain-containing protein [Desulfofundulus thermobenzoicus]